VDPSRVLRCQVDDIDQMSEVTACAVEAVEGNQGAGEPASTACGMAIGSEARFYPWPPINPALVRAYSAVDTERRWYSV
jgi:hypothetical protein